MSDEAAMTTRDGPPGLEGAARCRACGTAFTNAAWTGLELATRVAPREIRERVLGWPDDVCVEVRVCDCCRVLIAVKRRAASP